MLPRSWCRRLSLHVRGPLCLQGALASAAGDSGSLLGAGAGCVASTLPLPPRRRRRRRAACSQVLLRCCFALVGAPPIPGTPKCSPRGGICSPRGVCCLMLLVWGLGQHVGRPCELCYRSGVAPLLQIFCLDTVPLVSRVGAWWTSCIALWWPRHILRNRSCRS